MSERQGRPQYTFRAANPSPHAPSLMGFGVGFDRARQCLAPTWRSNMMMRVATKAERLGAPSLAQDAQPILMRQFMQERVVVAGSF